MSVNAGGKRKKSASRTFLVNKHNAKPDSFAFIKRFLFTVKSVMSDSEFSIRMSADEINCLVYSFLIDSGKHTFTEHLPLFTTLFSAGFKHSAFSLCMEGRLESSINFRKHIPRGELVDLLGKSLLYREVESHWKADHLATHCKAGFSLLDPHVCSLEPPKQQLPPLLALGYVQYPLGQSNRPNNTNDGKRKASPLSGKDVPAEKRPRRDADGMDVDRMVLRCINHFFCSHASCSPEIVEAEAPRPGPGRRNHQP